MLKQIGIGIILYFFWVITQKFLASDIKAENQIIDRIHECYIVKNINEYLQENINVTKFHLMLTTLLIDVNVMYVIGMGIYTNRLDSLYMIISGVILRQICQYITRLPIPSGILWFDPGFPTLLMVYEAQNDFFFSGHTLISLITGSNIFMNTSNIFIKLYAIIYVLYEIFFVIVTKSHYFMDVYAGITTFFMLTYMFEKINNYLNY